MEPLSSERLCAIDAHFRAANYLSVGQIYLRTNALLREPLRPEHIKSRLLGHWGTTPGLNFIYVHINRWIQEYQTQCVYIAGPGHGGPALRANVYLEGSMTEIYPQITQDAAGMEILMREFSWPGGVPSHVSPPTPGSIHEGGELGYSLVHAYGAIWDNPDLIAVCVVGDGEAETGPLAGGWQSGRFVNPLRDGAVLPILHVNGYKISGPTLFGRMSDEQIAQYLKGCGYTPQFIGGDDPMQMHSAFAQALDVAYEAIRSIQDRARREGVSAPFEWPALVLRTPKGWTGPKVVDGKAIEGTFRSHQVPVNQVQTHPEHLKILEEWMLSYKPHELFDERGHPVEAVRSLVPEPKYRMGTLPHANGGLLLKELQIPAYTDYAIDTPGRGQTMGEATRELGKFVRDILAQNPENFRIFCPDETNSNRLNRVFDVTNRTYLGKVLETDDHLAADGRIMEVLSEHLCQGWLEGYLLTGRHGLFPCYEAFALIVDSMLNQHGKWLKAAEELPWRKPIASLNYLLTSHAWRQDHNGYSHQGPGFIESVMQKKSSVARIYLPPDGNCLLSVADHCLRSKNYINLIIAGKQPMPQWLHMTEAQEHCAKGASIWEWASNDGGTPDVVMASAGDTPTLETLAAISILRKRVPGIKIRMVNVVDLFNLLPHTRHPHGFDEETFEALFTKECPVIFAFHGHPRVIHELTYKRSNPDRFHVRGYIEEGSTTTPFDMVVCNLMSRFHLAIEALHRIPRLKSEGGDFIVECKKALEDHKAYIYEHGEDMPEIANWKWDIS